eukprot:tig00021435_g21421.t1
MRARTVLALGAIAAATAAAAACDSDHGGVAGAARKLLAKGSEAASADADIKRVTGLTALAGGSGFSAAFVASFLVILVSEIGDKTFFIAAVMAMRHARAVVFAGAIGALGVMTALSAALGFVAPTLLPKSWTHYGAAALFVIFGFQLLRDAWNHKPGEANEEEQEVVEMLEKKDEPAEGSSSSTHKPMTTKETFIAFLEKFLSPIMLKAFTLTFLAEWGDRSQISTIALAAAKDPIGVTFGGILGHAICTGGAVLGGRLLASHISERTVALSGGILFLCFAIASFITGPPE